MKQISNDKFVNMKYPEYFAPEIKPFINNKLLPAKGLIDEINKELPKNFNVSQKKGENDGYLYNLIREDAVKDFIANVNRNSIPFDAKIDLSIFETNLLLSTNEIELIEYASFFGSIHIFTFLKKEGVELKSSLPKFAIHGKSAEIIYFLEDDHGKPEKSFKERLEHIDIVELLLSNDKLDINLLIILKCIFNKI